LRADVNCPVVEVRATQLRVPADPTDLDSSADTLLIEVVDEEGRVGIGECDTASPAAQALVTMRDFHAWNSGLSGAVVGADPQVIGAIWRNMAERTRYLGPGGIAKHAMAALDIALHDLAGQQVGRPVYDLLGGPARTVIHPYATVYAGVPGTRTVRELLDHTLGRMRAAVDAGFTAVKMELLFGSAATDLQLSDCIREGRAALGPDIVMLVDFGYRWTHWRDALAVLRRVEDCDLWLVEAAVDHDDLDGHAKLAPRIGPRLGGAELAGTVRECRAWIELGRVDVLQPDVARAGGLTEMRRIAEFAALHGVEVVPHNWKTGINAAAARHLQAAMPNVPLIEMFTADLFESPLRRGLVGPEPVLDAGMLPLPSGPGLGVTLDPAVVDRYQVAT